MLFSTCVVVWVVWRAGGGEGTRCFKYFSVHFGVSASWMNEHGRWKLRLCRDTCCTMYFANNIEARLALAAIVSGTKKSLREAHAVHHVHWACTSQTTETKPKRKKRETDGEELRRVWHGKMCSKTKNFASTNRTTKNFRSEFCLFVFLAVSLSLPLPSRWATLAGSFHRVHHFCRRIVLSACLDIVVAVEALLHQTHKSLHQNSENSFFRISWCIASHLAAQSLRISARIRSSSPSTKFSTLFLLLAQFPQIFKKPKEKEEAKPNGGHLNRTNKRYRITSKIGKYKVFWRNDEDVFLIFCFFFLLCTLSNDLNGWSHCKKERERERQREVERGAVCSRI